MYFLDKKINFLINKEDKKKIPILLIIVLISSFVEVLGLGVLIPLSNLVLNQGTMIDINYLPFLNYFENTNFNENLLSILIVTFFIIYLLKTILLIFTNYYQLVFGFNFNKNISNFFYSKYLNKEYFSFKDLSSSKFLRNTILEIDKLTEFLINNIKLISEIITFILITAFLFFYNFLPSLIISTIVCVFALTYYLILKTRIFKIGLKKQKFQGQKLKFLNSAFGGIKEIKMTYSEDHFYKKFSKFNKIISNAVIQSGLYNILPRYLIELLLVGVFCIFLYLAKFYNLDNNSIILSIPVYLLAFARLFPTVNRILISLQGMRLNKSAIDLIHKKMKEYNASSKLNNNFNKKVKINLKKSIKINIKNFKYSNNSKFKLKNINIEINKGEKVGIIGPTGSGKSTIIEILTNIIYLKNGDVLLDKKSTKDFVQEWRAMIGYIPQKIYILEDTLKNNICLNDKFKNKKLNYFVNIIKQAGLYSWYKKLPKGLNTNISERGLSLSGGEIQRLGIARALIHDPEILILDEATSALDTFTEREILKNIFKLKNKTFVCISHRIETFRNFDKIFMIKNGKIFKVKKK